MVADQRGVWLDERSTLWLFIFVVGVPRLIFWLSFGVQYDGDSAVYFSMIPGFLDGVKPDLCSPVHPPTESDVIYGPGYPLFVAAARLLPVLPWSMAVLFLQHAAAVIMSYLLYQLGRLEGFPLAGLAAGLLSGLASESLFLAQYLKSESIFAFEMVVFFWLLSRATGPARGRGRAAALTAAAAMLLVCIATRPGAWAFLPVAAVHLIVSQFDAWHPAMRDRIKAALLLGAVVLVGVLFIILYHGLIFGKWRLTTCIGRHLYNRVVGVCGLVDRAGPAAQKMRALTGGTVRGFWWSWFYRLRSNGLDVNAADELMGAVAWEGLRTAPQECIWQIARGVPLVMSEVGYLGFPPTPAADADAYWLWASMWPRSLVPEETFLRNTFLQRVQLVAPGEILPKAWGDTIYSASRAFVPAGRGRLFVWGYGVTAAYLLFFRSRSRRAFWVACLLSYLTLTVALEMNEIRYFSPCIAMAELLLFSVLSELWRWARRRVPAPRSAATLARP